MMRFGVVGTGYWAENVHLAALAAHPEVELAGICGRNPERTAELAERFGAKPFSDVGELAAEVEAVAFAVPPKVQAELAIEAARAGKHLLLEKPIAMDLPSAKALVAAAADASAVIVCFLTRLFVDESLNFIETARATGPQSGHATFHSGALLEGSPYVDSAWRQQEYGEVWDVSPHCLSILCPVLGNVEKARARPLQKGGFEAELVHVGGARSTIDIDLRDPGQPILEHYRFGESPTLSELKNPGYERTEAFATAIDTLLATSKAPSEGTPVQPEPAVHIVAVIEAMVRSLRSGGDWSAVEDAGSQS